MYYFLVENANLIHVFCTDLFFLKGRKCYSALFSYYHGIQLILKIKRNQLLPDACYCNKRDMPLTKVWQLNNDCAKFQETTLETVCQAKIFVLCHILIHPVLALCGSCFTTWFDHPHIWKKGHWSKSTSEKKQIFDTGMVTNLLYSVYIFLPNWSALRII